MKEKTFTRATRVADLIKEEVATLFLYEVNDPRVKGITITEVRIGDDLKVAKIYYVTPDRHEEAKVKEGLSKVKGFIRKELARKMSLRIVPEIEFHYDEVFEHGMHIEGVFRNIKNG